MNKSLEELMKYYENATKEEVIIDIYLDNLRRHVEWFGTDLNATEDEKYIKECISRLDKYVFNETSLDAQEDWLYLKEKIKEL